MSSSSLGKRRTSLEGGHSTPNGAAFNGFQVMIAPTHELALTAHACIEQAVLLTNGIDYRVHPLADKDHPKSTLPVGDIAILEHQLRLLELAGYSSDCPSPSSSCSPPNAALRR
jgi:hypothetical protein